MRYVLHWPSLTPLLFLAVYLPRRKRRTKSLIRLGRREWWPHWGVPPWNGRTLPEVGARPGGGFRKLSAYTRKKALGMTTRATATKAECNSPSQLGAAWAGAPQWKLDAFAGLPWHLHASSYTAPTSSTDETAVRGVSGGQPERAA